LLVAGSEGIEGRARLLAHDLAQRLAARAFAARRRSLPIDRAEDFVRNDDLLPRIRRVGAEEEVGAVAGRELEVRVARVAVAGRGVEQRLAVPVEGAELDAVHRDLAHA